MLISFVIPVYNTKVSGLKKCFDALSNICNLDYEVIIVDDGSTLQETSDFCQEYSKNKHFEYYRKENGGVSLARNFGVKNAKGKYITFVDSDDEFVSEKFDTNILNEDFDLIVYNIQINKYNHDSISSVKSQSISKEQVTTEYIKKVSLINGSFSHPFAKVISKNFLESNELKYDEKMIHGEDRMFNISILQKNPNVKYVDKTLYIYYLDPITYHKRPLRNPKLFLENCLDGHLQRLDLYNKEFSNISVAEFPRVYRLLLDEVFGAFINISHSKSCKQAIKDSTQVIDRINVELSKFYVNYNMVSKIKYMLFKRKCWVVFKLLYIARMMKYKINMMKIK